LLQQLMERYREKEYHIWFSYMIGKLRRLCHGFQKTSFKHMGCGVLTSVRIFGDGQSSLFLYTCISNISFRSSPLCINQRLTYIFSIKNQWWMLFACDIVLTNGTREEIT